MKASIITIGDELLLGQVVDTNSFFIAREVARLGTETVHMATVADTQEAIRTALAASLEVADWVFITGGLGPTKDDITKKTLALYFNMPLAFHPQAYAWIEELLASRPGAMNAYNKDQALLPHGCLVLRNHKGTASGMGFEQGGKMVFSLPGVPFEMEHLMQDKVLPLLQKKHGQGLLQYRVFTVYGIPESDLAIRLSAYEERLPAGVGLAYLPSAGYVLLRVTSKVGEASLLTAAGDLKQELTGLFFIEGEKGTVEALLAAILLARKQTLAVAESCTGGNLARLITAQAGASAYFQGGVVAYANEVKQNLLGVSADTLQQYGAVSEPVALQMAAGVRRALGADWAVATTGVAGPAGGTEQKPVGTVWVAVAGPGVALARKYNFSHTRERNIGKATVAALQLLLECMTGKK